MRTLVIGNKCYSSWSLRAWILLKMLHVPFEETLIPLDQADTAARIAEYSPAGRVPVLIDGERTVWDSIAIMEHIAETTDAAVWPTDPDARALARSISAEMHAGFPALRQSYPMNLGKRYARKAHPEAAQDVERVCQIVADARARFGASGRFLFGAFTAADAMYAPVMTRFDTYDVAVPPAVAAYRDAILATPAFQEWRDAALREPWSLQADEVDDTPIAVLRQVSIIPE